MPPLRICCGHTLYLASLFPREGGYDFIPVQCTPIPFPINRLIPNTLSFDLILNYFLNHKANAKNQRRAKSLAKEFDLLCSDFSWRMFLLLRYQLKNEMNFM